jgi:hypothetical protein
LPVPSIPIRIGVVIGATPRTLYAFAAIIAESRVAVD